MDNIVVAYLSSGQVVVAKRVVASEGFISLNDPHEIHVTPSPQDPNEIHVTPSPQSLQVGLVPFGSLFGVLPPLKSINPELMAPLVEAPQHLAAQFVKATSGLVLASGSPR